MQMRVDKKWILIICDMIVREHSFEVLNEWEHNKLEWIVEHLSWHTREVALENDLRSVKAIAKERNSK